MEKNKFNLITLILFNIGIWGMALSTLCYLYDGYQKTRMNIDEPNHFLLLMILIFALIGIVGCFKIEK